MEREINDLVGWIPQPHLLTLMNEERWRLQVDSRRDEHLGIYILGSSKNKLVLQIWIEGCSRSRGVSLRLQYYAKFCSISR